MGKNNSKKPAAKPQVKTPVVEQAPVQEVAPVVPEEIVEPVMDDPNAVTPEEAEAQPLLEEQPPVEQPTVEEVAPPAESPKSSVGFSDHLKATLAKHPHINNAWVNDKGEWHYSAKAGFTSYSREEILNG